MPQKLKLDLKQTFLIGLGFFAVSVSWAVYNAYVPLILAKWIANTTLIGMIMAIDNVFGVIFQPLFGRLSDKTSSKIGRRMPYILIGAPLAALAFILIPYTGAIWTLMGVVILFNFIMSAWRSPVVALMPDLTPPQLRSQGNGIINLWGGVGSVVAFLIGGKLFNLGGMPMPFLVAGLTMIGATIVLFLTVKERKVLERMGDWDTPPEETAPEQKTRLRDLQMEKGEKKSLFFLLFAILFWFCGYNATETFFTLFATNTFPALSEGDASMLLTYYSLAFLVMAVPSGYIAGKWGRKRSILFGLLVDIAVFTSLYFCRNLLLLKVLMIVGGLAWAFVNINSLPMVVELAGRRSIGTFTGLYYAFSQTAAILAPILFGLIRDITGNYSGMFLFAAISFALALGCMLCVKHGEAVPVKPSVIDTLNTLDS